MWSVVKDVQSLLKIGGISIDNWVFKLHYKLSVAILVIFSILVNSRQYFGDPIDCTNPDTEIKNYVDTYCWLNSYSLVADDGRVFLQVKKYEQILNRNKKLGVGDRTREYSGDLKDYKEVKQNYYQWIGVVLFFQAALFYLPRFLWKSLFEEGRVKELVTGIQSHMQDDSELIKRQEKIIEYIKNNKGHHLFYALQFFFCEVLNFVNVIGQMFLTDWFLGHAFLNYGLKWLWYDLDDDEHQIFHPSYRYFPKETLCRVYSGGAAHEVNVYSARCVLPIQIFNEKIYLFLWFYFIALAAISGLMLVYRILVLLLPNFRYFLFARRAWATDDKILRTVVRDFDIGDWFVLYQMMKNMDPFVFARVMKRIYDNVLNGARSPSFIRGGGEESQDELLGTFSPNAPFDEKHEKLNNQGLPQGYFTNK